MRIDTNPWSALDAVNGSDRDHARATTQGGAVQAEQRESDISEEAQLGARLMDQFAAIPDVRDERVAQLRSVIQSGAYSVTSEETADAMVRDALPGGRS